MPIYEYRCEECGERFDKFVRSAATPIEVVCPKCQSVKCRKSISLFGMSGSSTQSAGAAASCAPSG